MKGKENMKEQTTLHGFLGDHHSLYLIGTAACQGIKIMIVFLKQTRVKENCLFSPAYEWEHLKWCAPFHQSVQILH
jgi:hypothetical protein